MIKLWPQYADCILVKRRGIKSKPLAVKNSYPALNIGNSNSVSKPVRSVYNKPVPGIEI